MKKLGLLLSLGLLSGCGRNAAPGPTPVPGTLPNPLPSIQASATQLPGASLPAAQAAAEYARHASLLGSNLSGPNGLAIDANDTLYESDYFRGTVTRITQSGQTSTYASGFAGPAGLAFDQAGNLYVACYESHRFERIPPGGGTSTNVVSQGLRNPVWPAIDRQGIIYLADYNNNRIASVTSNGTVRTFANFGGVNAISIDPQNNLWITNWGGDITRITSQNQPTRIASGLSTACGIAWSPSFLAVVTYGGENGRNGQLYLVDFQGNRHLVASGLDRPSSVIFDSQGNLYSANIGDTSLRKYSLR